MDEFYDRARKIRSSSLLKNSFKKHFDIVFSAIDKLQIISSKAKLRLYNIEDLYSALEMARIVRGFTNFSLKEIEETIESLKIVITSTIENSIKFKIINNKPEPHDVYHNLVNRVQYFNSKASVSIITFNYDIALDYAFFHENITIDYALINEVTTDAIPVLKLHGSLNWGYCEKCKKVSQLDFNEYFSKYDCSDSSIKIGSYINEFAHSCKTGNYSRSAAIVPPTWFKLSMYNDIYNVWSRAAKELSQASIIVVIGYSLPATDVFFKYLYAIGTIGTNLIQKFIVINPDSNAHNHFKSLLGPLVLEKYHEVSENFKKDMPEIVKGINSII